MRNYERAVTYSSNPERTPTTTPVIDHGSQTLPSSLPSPAKSRDTKASVTRFDRRTMENLFQAGLSRADGELHKDSTLCLMRTLG